MDMTVLSVEEDGSYIHRGLLITKPKQKVIVALRGWIQKHGEGGKVYMVAAWKTPPIKAEVGFTLVEQKYPKLPKPPKPAPVEVEG